MEKVKNRITEVKTRNGWNRERDVKEGKDNFIQIIKGKLEQTAPKRKKKPNNLGNGGKGIIGNKEKQPECVWWNTECDKVIRIRKLNCLNGNTVKQMRHFWNTKGRRLARKINSEKSNKSIGKLSARELINSRIHRTYGIE
jgi:hypothetical protein